jgi:hypothetical protein
MTTKTIKFETPVIHDGVTYAELTLRKLKAKDLVFGDLVKGDTRRAMAIFASMADVNIKVIEELDIDDFEHLGVEAAPLMGKSAQAAMSPAK